MLPADSNLIHKITALADSVHTLSLPINEMNSQSSHLEEAYYISQIISALVLIGYVFFTDRTYAQIKRQADVMVTQSDLLAQQTRLLSIQTDLLLDAKLTFEFIKCDKVEDIKAQYKTDEIIDDQLKESKHISEKSRNSLKDHFPEISDELFKTGIYFLSIRNHGNTAVDRIKINLKVAIENPQEILGKVSLMQTVNSECTFNIEKQLQEKRHLIVPIINVGSFPKYKLEIDGEYFDIREKKYDIKSQYKENENSYFFPPMQSLVPKE